MRSRFLLFIIQLILVLPLFGGNPGSLEKWMEEKPRGLYNVTGFSVITSTGQSMNGMQTIFGYRLCPQLGAGLGAGIERFTQMPLYDVFKANLTMLPIFVDLRYTAIKKKLSPLIAVNLGYKVLLNEPSTQYITSTVEAFPGMAWNTYYDNDTYNRGGFFLGAEAGFRIMIYKRLSLNCVAGYSLWSVSGTRNKWNYEYLSAPGGTEKVTVYYAAEKSRAITHTFLFRIGFGF